MHPRDPRHACADAPTVIKDRADAPVSRLPSFLRAVIARVPLTASRNLFFAPLRQGGETWIVVAARASVLELVLDAEPEPALADLTNSATAPAFDAEPEAPAAPESEDAGASVSDLVASDVLLTDGVVLTEHGVGREAEPTLVAGSVESAESPYLDEGAVEATMAPTPEPISEPMSEPVSEPTPEPAAPPIVRHTVYTARYRLVLKGPERGRWEADVVDEADAPLVTVGGAECRRGRDGDPVTATPDCRAAHGVADAGGRRRHVADDVRTMSAAWWHDAASPEALEAIARRFAIPARPACRSRSARRSPTLGTERHLPRMSPNCCGRTVRMQVRQRRRTLEVRGLVERDFGEGFKRYEAARGIPHHEHLLSVCGRVTEFRDERLERMTTLLAEAHDFAPAPSPVIYGLCGECAAALPAGAPDAPHPMVPFYPTDCGT
jgi:Fur family ferric uptake transcriptional regulator